MTARDEMTGPCGTATRVQFAPSLPPHSGVATWWVHAPGQSAGWQNFALHVIHLRDLPGVPAAHVRVGGATHEVMVLAVDPTAPCDPTDPSTWRYLFPQNVAEQVHLHDDAEAEVLGELCAKAIVDGHLWAEPPLSGQVEPWRSSMILTTAHLRGEPHAGQVDGSGGAS